MLNKKKRLFTFILLFSSLSIQASIKICHNQEAIDEFKKNPLSITKLESCVNQDTSLVSYGFKKGSDSAFILDKGISNKIFYFSFPMIHQVKFYDFSNPKVVKEYKYSKVNNTGNEYVMINLLDQADAKVVALTNTKSSIQLPYLTFDSEENFTQFLKSKLLFDGLWFGILTLTCFLTLLMFLIKKNKEILFYLIHIFSIIMIQSAFSGYFFSYLSFLPDFFLHRIVVLSCSTLTIGTVGLIYTNFTKKSKSNKIFDLYHFILYIGLVHFAFSVFTYSQVTIKLTSYLTLLLSIGTILICVYAMVKRRKNAALFFLAFSLFLFSSLAFTCLLYTSPSPRD